MKLIIKINLIVLCVVGFLSHLNAQDTSVDSEEGYFKANVGISKFKLLGVTQRQYARCVETENYLEPEKTLKFLVIEKTSFADDGHGYDLKAGDGILTSNELFNYDNSSYVLPGTYKEAVDYNKVVADESFNFMGEVNRSSGIGFKCTFKWVPCSQQTPPAQAALCNWAGWPYGSFIIQECHIDFNILPFF